MFNNFISEKKSKFKTKGKIVITKKSFNPGKPYPVIQPDPDRIRYNLTESNQDSLTWTKFDKSDFDIQNS